MIDKFDVRDELNDLMQVQEEEEAQPPVRGRGVVGGKGIEKE